MARWKSTEDERKKFSARFLKFEEGKPKRVTISDWDFSKSPSGYLFRCYVTEEDGEKVDKIWTVWDFASAQTLKKKLGTRYITGKKELEVVMKLDDDDEAYFEINS